MDKKNKQILIGLGLVLIGVLIGWVIASRQYGQGPLANLNALQSSANMSAGGWHLQYFDGPNCPQGWQVIHQYDNYVFCASPAVKAGIGGTAGVR